MEKNSISKRIKKIIISIVQIIVLEKGIDNILWPKIILPLTYIQKFCLIQAFKDLISLIEIQYKRLPDL